LVGNATAVVFVILEKTEQPHLRRSEFSGRRGIAYALGGV
jgi:hypothetical protein